MVIADKTTSALVDALFAARTAADIEALIASVEGAEWRNLGQEEVGNFAQINSAAGPVDALMEKITNAFDALIEREVQLSGNSDFESPRDAVEALFGVPKGHLEFISDPERRRQLAAQITVTMRSSDSEDEPSFTVCDAGVGQHPDDFARTLVSLNLRNKRDKFYLIGAYGWGGSAALAFSRYTLFISRRDPRLLEGRPDQVGWTVVRFNDLAGERTAKFGEYQYLSLPGGLDGAPRVPRFDATLLPEKKRAWSGTSCTLIRFEIGQIIARAPAWLGAKSLRNVSNAALFDPPLPFIVRDERAKQIAKSPKNAEGVIVLGNATRLAELSNKKRSRNPTGDDIDEEEKEAREVGVAHDDLARRQLTTGGWVKVRHWVMGQPTKYKKGWQPARSYVLPEQAVTLTHNGQRHAAWGVELFEVGVGFSSLGKAIIAQVDVDELDWTEKRRLFTATRDQLRKTDLAQALRALVVKVIEEDDYLKREEKKRRERALSHESKEQAARIQRMLEKAIAAFRLGKVDLFQAVMSSDSQLPLYTDQPLAEEEPPPEGPDNPEVEPVQYTDGPTYMRVINSPVHVPAGGRAIVRIQMDAPDDYFERVGGGEFNALITKGADSFRFEGYSSLRNGMMRCTVSATGATPGDRGHVIFTVTRSEDALPLVEDAELEADPPKQKRVKPAGKLTEGKVTGPPVKACYKSQWEDVGGFDETIVALLVPELGNPDLYTIWVNADYRLLNDKLRRERRMDEEIAGGFKERFVASMGFLVWLQRTQGAEVNQDELRRAAEVHLFTTLAGAGI